MLIQRTIDDVVEGMRERCGEIYSIRGNDHAFPHRSSHFPWGRRRNGGRRVNFAAPRQNYDFALLSCRLLDPVALDPATRQQRSVAQFIRIAFSFRLLFLPFVARNTR